MWADYEQFTCGTLDKPEIMNNSQAKKKKFRFEVREFLKVGKVQNVGPSNIGTKCGPKQH